jgi:hypothetical protein
MKEVSLALIIICHRRKMVLEDLIKEYIIIEDKMIRGFGFNHDFAKKDSVAAVSKFEYLNKLHFIILDLIMEENDIKSLQYLIEKYNKELFGSSQLLISLYKRYLTLDPAHEQYYKNLAETIIANKAERTWGNAQKMYKYAQEHNWKEATETLNTISY